MKKTIWLIGLCSIICGSLLGQRVARPELAVVDFSTNITNDKIKSDAKIVKSIVESRLSNSGKFRMITRDKLDELLKNQKIQASAISSDENIKKLQLTNVGYIVTGSINATDNKYVIVISVISVSDGQIRSKDSIMGSSSEALYNGTTALIDDFLAGMATRDDRIISNRNYKIGDFGRGGGIIFYDKGNFSDGWQYLEAAPVEREFNAKWGAKGQNINTRTGVGSGRENTKRIVEELNKLGETGNAAQECSIMSFNGLNDWFLPSKDELDWMYKNLKWQGKGDFSNSFYWSSSQSSTSAAWYQGFRSGNQDNGSKNNEYKVRPIRAF